MINIKNLRKRTGCTQKEAAQILGVALRTLQDWESGARNPKDPDEVVERLEALTHLTREQINSVLSESLDLDWAVSEKKYSDTKKLSKWGSFGEIFQANWDRIPAGLKTKLTAEELAELVDVIKTAYDDGHAKTEGH